jgi:hypothetical protein
MHAVRDRWQRPGAEPLGALRLATARGRTSGGGVSVRGMAQWRDPSKASESLRGTPSDWAGFLSAPRAPVLPTPARAHLRPGALPVRVGSESPPPSCCASASARAPAKARRPSATRRPVRPGRCGSGRGTCQAGGRSSRAGHPGP